LTTTWLADAHRFSYGQAGPTFAFTAAGDHGANADTNASLAALVAARVDFHLALGDMSYDQVFPETAWCDYVKSYLGPEFPFQLIAGDHEDDFRDAPGHQSFIDNFAACLPDRLNSTGLYGIRYYFDFPVSAPLARFILIAPNLTLNGVRYDYSRGTPHYAWLSDAIDDARLSRLPWVVVGMSNACVTMGIKSCDGGPDLMSLLISRKVDLVLQGDDHNYQRSKQLGCAVVGSYVPDCVGDDGSDDRYEQGAGTVFVVSGTFGRSLYKVSAADPEAGYFVKSMGLGTTYGSEDEGTGFGFVRYGVSRTSINAEFIFAARASAGTAFSDTFDIVARAGPQIQTVTVTVIQTGTQTVTQTVTRTLGTQPAATDPLAVGPEIVVPLVAIAAVASYLVSRRRRVRTT
jgi:hypothetical protein